ncbi:hypothetical protein KFE25_006368 [Diacronema lutheri]|uniref:Plastid lipid-associated protein/fibrillin conserved domain-containing protein n=1 Tax=Diacronema lutheri TaxID=2081491 RepID=A0A8J6CJG5_DIALT|nr:hypothetical protein KFE25_006368 [Diacronema lutheri]
MAGESAGRARQQAVLWSLVLCRPVAGVAVDAKSTLIRLAALTSRGQTASAVQLALARRAIQELEGAGAGRVPWAPSGTWELVFSDVAPFRASPFFMALGKVLDDFRPGAAERNLLAHRLATSVGEIGKVTWSMTPASLVSEVELRVGLLPGVPAQLTGRVVTQASLARDDPASPRLLCSVVETRVLGSTLTVALPDVSSGGQTSPFQFGKQLQPMVASVAFPSGALLGGQQVCLAPVYVDDELLIMRCVDISAPHSGFAFLRAD